MMHGENQGFATATLGEATCGPSTASRRRRPRSQQQRLCLCVPGFLHLVFCACSGPHAGDVIRMWMKAACSEGLPVRRPAGHGQPHRHCGPQRRRQDDAHEPARRCVLPLAFFHGPSVLAEIWALHSAARSRRLESCAVSTRERKVSKDCTGPPRQVVRTLAILALGHPHS